MNDYLLAISIGVLSSLIASLVFLLFLTKIRPDVIISDKISKSIDSATGELSYKIKIINKTSRSIINIRPQLLLISLIAMPGGMIEHTKIISVKYNHIMEISKFDLQDKNAEYAWRLITTENIDDLWEDDAHSFLRLKIFATDSFSGFGKIFHRDYHIKKSCIEEGNFEFGNSIKIK